MPWFVIAVIVWLVLRAMSRGRAPGARLHGCARASWSGQRDYAQLHRAPSTLPHDRAMRAHPAARPVESRYDVLKRRYVGGELTDEQYEQALDTLIREPGGMREI